MREKSRFDILNRIESERVKRGWTEYTLARNAGLTQSTISTWYRKDLQPSIASIEKICDGFGLSLAQFFADESDHTVTVTEDQAMICELWLKLTPSEKAAVTHLLQVMSSHGTDNNNFSL